MRDKHHFIEEPCEGKLSRTVLETNGVGDSLVEFNIFKAASPMKRSFQFTSDRIQQLCFESKTIQESE